MKVELIWSDEMVNITGRKVAVVLVDTLRASSSIAIALGSGAKEVIVFKDVTLALDFKAENVIHAGEREGVILPGFDIGNSPSFFKEFAEEKNISLTTNNFCRIIEKFAGANTNIIAGTLLNGSSVAKYLVNNNFDEVIFVCVGTYDFVLNKDSSLLRGEEDFLGAAYIIRQLEKISGNELGIIDEYRKVLDSHAQIIEQVENCRYATYLKSLDSKFESHINQKDIEVCTEIDTVDVVPILNIDEKGNMIFSK
jgi:2-phosphosulfolactate phosphatase